MSSKSFPYIHLTSIPEGSKQWEDKRSSILADFASKVPEEYYIAQHFVDDPPKDVTGIPRACGILTTEELEITENYDAVALAAAIATRKYTAVAVAKAFTKRAIICHQISCCLTQWFPDEAIAQAKALDEHLERTGKTVGPLHGVPISIKEHIPIAGHPSSAGYISTIMQDESDALIVAILRKLGAVFYVKTNQPQSIMHLESNSHFGRVLNPHNIKLSAGGSTGGEAALVALKGSVLGVGTDIGGSIRGPAGFCGIYGFKPTCYTLPMQNSLNGGAPAELNILISIGPLCRSLRDMDFFTREILAQKPYLSDPRVIPIPWTGLQTPIDQPLKVGIMMTDGVITPQPPVARALTWAKTRLSASSLVQLKPFYPHEPARAISLIRKMYWPDGGHGVKEHLSDSGEPMHPLTAWIIKDAEAANQKNATEIHSDRLTRDAFRSAFAESWTTQDVDVVICPVFFGPAAAHDTSFYWNYTALWNFVDYPGAVFPTPITAGAKGTQDYESKESLGEEDDHVRRMWEENDYEGAPIDLQIVARKHHDNLLFGAMGVLAELLGLR